MAEVAQNPAAAGSAAAAVAPRSGACRNCGTGLRVDTNYCTQCGQRVIEGRLTLREILHDLIHALTHADKNIFALMWALLVRPGRVAREYVEGRRKRYFGPFAFLVIMVGIATTIILLTDMRWFNSVENNPAGPWFDRHINIVLFLSTPLSALALMLFFRKERLNFAEHLILAAYTTGFRVLALGLVLTPFLFLSGLTIADTPLVYCYFALWFSYFGFACSQFYTGNRWWLGVKGFFAAILAQLFMFAAIFVVIVLIDVARG